jgi:hypothetical protein
VLCVCLRDLEKRIASGSLRLVEEKHCMQEINTLKRARGTAEAQPKKTDGGAAAAAPNPKEAELERAIAELDSVKKELNGLRDARSAEYGAAASATPPLSWPRDLESSPARVAACWAHTDALNALRDQQGNAAGQIRKALAERSALVDAHRQAQNEYRKYAQEEQNRRREGCEQPAHPCGPPPMNAV